MEVLHEFSERVFDSHLELKDLIERARKEGKKIVITQGSYDILHIGHARYLLEASRRGDILIVGIDNDAYTRARKGEGRPVIPENERAEMLLHLRYVDYVVLHTSKEDAVEFIQMVRPDVLVVSESTSENFVEKMTQAHGEYCKSIVGLPAQAETSTSAKVRLMFVQGMYKFRDYMVESFRDMEKKLNEFVEIEKNGGPKS